MLREAVPETEAKVMVLEPTLTEAAMRSKPSDRFRVMPGDPPDAELKFGKYRGRLVSELAKSDPDYLSWILKEGFDNILKRIIIAQGVRPPKLSEKVELTLKDKSELIVILRSLGVEDDGAASMYDGLALGRLKATKERIATEIIDAKRRIRARE